MCKDAFFPMRLKWVLPSWIINVLQKLVTCCHHSCNAASNPVSAAIISVKKMPHMIKNSFLLISNSSDLKSEYPREGEK